MIQWRTFMPLNFSLAYPLNKQPGDLTQPFSFSAGTSILVFYDRCLVIIL